MTYEEAHQHALEAVTRLREEYRVAPLFVQVDAYFRKEVLVFHGDLLTPSKEIACFSDHRWWDVSVGYPDRRLLYGSLHTFLIRFCSFRRDPLERLAEIKEVP